MHFHKRENSVIVAGHRGVCAEYPENTMLSYRKAIELGVDQLEIDLNLTKDGHIVLIHDCTVDRTTEKSGRVRDYTLEEIRKISPRTRFLILSGYDEFEYARKALKLDVEEYILKRIKILEMTILMKDLCTCGKPTICSAGTGAPICRTRGSSAGCICWGSAVDALTASISGSAMRTAGSV